MLTFRISLSLSLNYFLPTIDICIHQLLSGKHNTDEHNGKKKTYSSCTLIHSFLTLVYFNLHPIQMNEFPLITLSVMNANPQENYIIKHFQY